MAFELRTPFSAPAPKTESQLQVTVPQAAPDYGALAGAGIQAAGQTIGTIAQIAGQANALQLAKDQAAIGNAASEKLAKMQLAAEQEMFAGRKQDALQGMLLSAIQRSMANTSANRELRRSANAGMDEVLSRAFLRR